LYQRSPRIFECKVERVAKLHEVAGRSTSTSMERMTSSTRTRTRINSSFSSPPTSRACRECSPRCAEPALRSRRFRCLCGWGFTLGRRCWRRRDTSVRTCIGLRGSL
jgi:hypothetical protein